MPIVALKHGKRGIHTIFSTYVFVSCSLVYFIGYGLTETSPAAMVCPRNNCKPGAVGVMLPNLEGKVESE